jgi:hypothetical protein
MHHGRRRGILAVAASSVIVVIATIAAILGGAALANAQHTVQGTSPEIFNAYAVNTAVAQEPGGKGRLEVVAVIIERWSTEEERQALVQAFDQKGPDGLLAVLKKMERLGTLRASSTLGWDLRYAFQEPTEGGGRRIIAATERKVSHWQAGNDQRAGYPFTLVELRLDKDGKGEGRLSVATKIARSKDGKGFELENYSAEPIHLQDVHRQKN